MNESFFVVAPGGANNSQHDPEIYDFPACGSAMMFSADTPNNKRDYSCVANGASGQTNSKGNIVSFFVNGVGNSERESLGSAQLLSEKLGRAVVRVHNSSESVPVPIPFVPSSANIRLPLQDFAHAAVAKVSPSLSSWMEPSVSFLRSAIAKVLRQNPSVEVDLHAHSQGGIIVRGALRELRTREFSALSEQEWWAISSRIHVTTYGSAEHNFTLPATEYAHSLDIVPLGTSLIDWVRRLVVESRQRLKRQEVLSVGHSFSDYLHDLPKFLAQELLSRPYNKPSEVVNRLDILIGARGYAPEVLDAVCREVLKALPAEDRSEVKRLLPDARLIGLD